MAGREDYNGEILEIHGDGGSRFRLNLGAFFPASVMDVRKLVGIIRDDVSDPYFRGRYVRSIADWLDNAICCTEHAEADAGKEAEAFQEKARANWTFSRAAGYRLKEKEHYWKQKEKYKKNRQAVLDAAEKARIEWQD